MSKSDYSGPENDEIVPHSSGRLQVLEDIARKFEHTVKVQRALIQIASFASNEDDLQSFYRRVHEVVRKLTSAENLFIALIDEDAQQVMFPYFVGPRQARDKSNNLDLSAVKQLAVTSLIIERRDLVHLGKSKLIELGNGRGFDPATELTPEDWLGVPLLHGDDLLGAMAIQSFEPGFRYSLQDESMLRQVSQHVASALQRKNFMESLTETKLQLESKNRRLKKLLYEREEIHNQLKHNAAHDSLTGLPNRSLLLKQLRQVIERTQDEPEHQYAVLFLDLDRFKVVNDSLGHLVGDALLVEIGLRLRNCVRPSDLVSRLGGDEFCVLLKQDATPSVVNLVAGRILETLRRPVLLDGQRVVTGTSIGVALGNKRYQTAENVLRDADTALYQAKASGKSTFRVFDQSMREEAISRLRLEQALRAAIEESEIAVHYQPIVEIQSGRVVSFEARAHWAHPTMGEIPSEKFISVAEEIHLTPQLTMLVIRQAVSQVCQWRTEIPGLSDLGLNVNISGRQIGNVDFVSSVDKVLRRANLAASNLNLEVTESLLLNNMEKATQVLKELHQNDIGLTLDNFGTGFSSLSCLNALPLDELKIDLSFVRNIAHDPKSQAIVQMVVALADVMCLKVIAEGVQTESQLDMLGKLGVNFAQGSLFGEPASVTAITRRLCESAKGVILPTHDAGVPHQNLVQS